jgi:glycine/serine hydroxymethyltransferase
MITSAAENLILDSVIAESIDNIDVISISKSSGEFFRKAYQNKETISGTERKYTFYLTEVEANDTIIKLSLYGNGATTTLGTGTEMAYSSVNIVKTNTQSLLISWNVKVVTI